MNLLSPIRSSAAPLPKRAQRRWLIVTMYVLCPALIGGCWWLHVVVHPAFSFAMLGVVGVLLLLWNRFAGSKEYLTNLPLSHLDERQLAVRGQAYQRAYQILTGLVLVLGLYVGLGSFNTQWFLPRDFFAWLILFFGLTILITSLPTAVFAWSELDLSEEAV
jgi:hypothetical protein